MFRLHFSAVAQLLLVRLAFASDEIAAHSTKRAPNAAATCDTFQKLYPDITFFPNETTYADLNQDYFTSAAWLGPACIVAPTDSATVSAAVKTLVRSGVKFAVRGGGHMPIAGSNNIDDSGILLSSSGLNQLRISADRKTVAVGPGNRWSAAYRYLEPYGLSVVGGRLGVVGVPGFLLGGGISFFGNEYGWASANVASVEGVLADGTIVKATATNKYSDLFWALRGGGNSFAIVTSFELRTVPAPAVSVGQVSWGTGVRDQFLDSVHGFAFDGVLDKKAAVIPTVNWGSRTGPEPAYSGMLFYNGDDTTPAALANFTGPDAILPTVAGGLQYRSMADWANETDAGFGATHGLNFRFHVLSLVANREAIGIIHDTYINLAKQRLANVANVFTTLAVMPISKSFITANRGASPSGDPFGIDASKAPYIWVEESTGWSNPADKPTIDAFLEEVNAAIDKALAPLNVASPYLYLNDADKGQPVFEGYASANVERLKRIRFKYDPWGVYTYQLPGGFKVALAK